MKHFPLPDTFYQQMEDIQAIDFVIVELNLYLDTHPDDLDALKQFNTFTKRSKELKQAFEAEFGPLQGSGNSFSTYPWAWNDAPWPWQI